jgi:hypothetical protein
MPGPILALVLDAVFPLVPELHAPHSAAIDTPTAIDLVFFSIESPELSQ